MTKYSKILLQKWHSTALNPLLSTLFTVVLALLVGIAAYWLKKSDWLPSDDPTFDYFPFIAGIGTVVLSSSTLTRTALDLQTKALESAMASVDASNLELSENFESQREIFTRDFVELSRNFKAMARRTKAFQLHGAAFLAAPELISRIANAKNVANTFVGLKDKYSNDSDKHSGITQSYEGWLTNEIDGTWTDIVGVKEFFSDRFKSITTSNRYFGDHRVLVLRHSMPILNFIILSFSDDRPDEVIFGWLPNDSEGASEVFSTSDKNVVSMFRTYFSILSQHTWNSTLALGEKEGFKIDYSRSKDARLKSPNIGLVDKEGAWITVSYTKDLSSEEYLATRIGFLKIQSSEIGLRVTARIYDDKGVIEEDETEHREIAHYLDSIFIGYQLSDRNFSGICHYKFKKYDHGETIQGVYVDRRDERRNVLIGIRSTAFKSFENFRPTETEVLEFLKKHDEKFRILPNFKRMVHGPDVLDFGKIG